MKFIVNSAAFNKALRSVSPAVSKNVVMPVLAMVLVDVVKNKCRLTATNLNLTITETIECESGDEFRVLLPFDETQRITDVLGNQPITIEATKTQALIGGKHKIGIEPNPAVFPDTSEFESDFEVDADEELLYNLQLATNCTTKSHMVMANICVSIEANSVSIFATDAFQMFRYHAAGKGFPNTSLIVNADYVKSFKAIKSGRLSANSKFVQLSDDNTTIVMKQSECAFPECDKFFTDFEYNCVVDRRDLVASINKLMVFGGNVLYVFVMRFDDNGEMAISFDNNDLDYHFSDKITCIRSSVGTDGVALNAAFVKNILSLMPEEDNVRLQITNKETFIRIDPETNDNLNFVLVPLLQ